MVIQFHSALLILPNEMKAEIALYPLVASGIKKLQMSTYPHRLCSFMESLGNIHLILFSLTTYLIYQCLISILEIILFFFKEALLFLKN